MTPTRGHLCLRQFGDANRVCRGTVPHCPWLHWAQIWIAHTIVNAVATAAAPLGMFARWGSGVS
jgi:hypothetical protein